MMRPLEASVLTMSELVHELISHTARRTPDAEALAADGHYLSYAALDEAMCRVASGFLGLGLGAGERAAVYLEKRIETVVALFAISAAGGVFVPVNPLLKPQQVGYVLAHCNVRVLVTSASRLEQLTSGLAQCPDLHTVVVVDEVTTGTPQTGLNILTWWELINASVSYVPHRRINADIAAILYTSGSTGRPKGVVLSHRNLVIGAKSVAQYLGNTASDRLLAVLPLSFDYGLSQLTTAFHAGACAVVANYWFPKDIVNLVEKERITGLAGVPPLWQQLAEQQWPEKTGLRYITNSGGAMPSATLTRLQSSLKGVEIFLMYGLTEAFRSTYLPPGDIARKPDSIGRAIPNAEVMVVRPDGTACEPYERGELVHRGSLVSLGYWNDPAATVERFKPAPGQPAELPLTELAVWSGDTVYRDEEGYLYFVGRTDEMIKISGYRISPTEIEEVLLGIKGVSEAVALGVPHPGLGQAIVAIVYCQDASVAAADILRECKRALPAYMVPSHIDMHTERLPRNPNGKLDRSSLRQSRSNMLGMEFSS